MRQIYSCANQVDVFLTDNKYDDEYVGEEGFEELAIEAVRVIATIPAQGFKVLSSNAMRAYLKFLALPWFTRVWIIQEYVLARAVVFHWGTTPYCFNDVGLYNAIFGLDDHENLSSPPWRAQIRYQTIRELLDKRRDFEEDDGKHLLHTDGPWENVNHLLRMRDAFHRGERQSLLDHLVQVRDCTGHSTLEVDRLFALLGFAEDGNHEALAPDYEEPIGSVFRRYGRYLIAKSGINLLYGAGVGENVNADMPSWVPDWRKSGRDCGNLILSEGVQSGMIRTRFYTTGIAMDTKLAFDPETDSLVVTGVFVDKVNAVSQIPRVIESYLHGNRTGISKTVADTVWQNFRENILLESPIPDALDICEDHPARQHPHGSLEQIKARIPERGARKTIIYVQDHLLALKPLVQPMQINVKDTWNIQATVLVQATSSNSAPTKALLNALNLWLGRISNTEASTIEKNLAAAMEPIGCNPRYCRTESHCIGVVPVHTRVNDLVFIPYGSQYPMIIRKSETRPGMYRLVGVCYVHRLMRGEGLNMGISESHIKIH